MTIRPPSHRGLQNVWGKSTVFISHKECGLLTSTGQLPLLALRHKFPSLGMGNLKLMPFHSCSLRLEVKQLSRWQESYTRSRGFQEGHLRFRFLALAEKDSVPKWAKWAVSWTSQEHGPRDLVDLVDQTWPIGSDLTILFQGLTETSTTTLNYLKMLHFPSRI